eukprot:1105929-Rhodomonas_salina.1
MEKRTRASTATLCLQSEVLAAPRSLEHTYSCYLDLEPRSDVAARHDCAQRASDARDRHRANADVLREPAGARTAPSTLRVRNKQLSS